MPKKSPLGDSMGPSLKPSDSEVLSFGPAKPASSAMAHDHKKPEVKPVAAPAPKEPKNDYKDVDAWDLPAFLRRRKK